MLSGSRNVFGKWEEFGEGFKGLDLEFVFDAIVEN